MHAPEMMLASSDAWLPSRLGYATASRANDIRDYKRDGSPGAGLVSYCHELVTERLTDNVTDHPPTKWMQRGKEQQPFAASEFELQTGYLLGPEVWVKHPTIEWAGATPDALLGDDGLVEFKVPAPTTWTKWASANEIPQEHINQMLMQLACTRRRYVYFCAYQPEGVPGRRLFVRKFEPPQSEIEALEDDVRKFLKRVEDQFEMISTMELVQCQ